VPAVLWLADLVREGYVGEILSTTVVASTAGWGGEVSEGLRYTLDRESGATMLTIAFGHAIYAVTLVVGEVAELMATTATRRARVALAGTGLTVPMTAEDQIAVSGTLSSGAVLSVHYRGGTLSGPGFSMLIDGTEGTLRVSAPNHPHIAPITVLGARGDDPLAELTLPARYDDQAPAAGTPRHALTHAYAAIRSDLVHGTSRAPDFAHAVQRHRLLDAIQRSAATGRRVRLNGYG
jgi:predicted dehydrogenase